MALINVRPVTLRATTGQSITRTPINLRRIISFAFLVIVFLVLLTEVFTRHLQAQENETVAAVINGKEIQVSEIDYVLKSKPAYAPLMASEEKNPDKLNNIRMRALQSMIDRELLLEAANKSSAGNESEIKKTSEQVVASYGGPEKLSEMLKPSGVTIETFLSDLNNDLKISKYLDQTLMKKVSITEEDLKKAFQQSPQKYAERESIRARHILIKVQRGAAPEEEKRAKEKIDLLHQEVLKANADFAAIAKQSSECPSAPQGGDLGYFSKGTMVPEFERVAFLLKPNEISAPVRSDFGYHIIKLEDKKEGAKPNYERAKPLIERDLSNQKKSALVTAHIKELRKSANIDVKLKAS